MPFERDVKVMNLSLSKDKILLKNCIVVKLQQLKLAKETPAIKDEISYYENIYEILKADDTETLMLTLKDPTFKEAYRSFNEHILSTPAKDIAQEYIDLTKSFILKNCVYDEEKFKQLKAAFYKGNEDLLSKTPEEYEEEPEQNHSSNHLTKAMETSLNQLKNLMRQNPKTMSGSQFRNLAGQFRDLTLDLGKRKFQQYFDKNGQTIIENGMQISYDTSNPLKPTYTADFTLLDNATSQQTHLNIAEPTSKSTYFQNLCYSYLEADTYANIDESLLDTDIISGKMNDFRNCYEKLDEMMKRCEITITDNIPFYYTISEVEPSELDLQACNSDLEIDTELEI